MNWRERRVFEVHIEEFVKQFGICEARGSLVNQ